MPVRNEEKRIETTLDMLLSQDYSAERYEIIVADGDSYDATATIVRRMQVQHSQIILKHNAKQSSSSGRNIGLEHGRGDIFVVIDGHCHIPDNQLFNNIVACFEKSGASCLGRPQPLSPPNISSFQQFVANARGAAIGHAYNSLIYYEFEGFVSPQSHGAIYKKEVLEKVKYFDEVFDACEDVEFNFRVEKAGFNTFMSPSLAVNYYPRESVFDLFRQMKGYGKGRINLLAKHSETFSLKGLVPLFFVVGIILNFLNLMFTTNKVFLIICLMPYILYLLIVLFYSIQLSKPRSSKETIQYLIIFFTIHSGLGVGQFLGIISLIKASILKSIRQRLMT
jgi:glycosyltransferase involved in cell wall biosynthesis